MLVSKWCGGVRSWMWSRVLGVKKSPRLGWLDTGRSVRGMVSSGGRCRVLWLYM